MTSTITFDVLLDEINTSYDHPQINRSKYENWLFETFGECVEVNVIRWRNRQTFKKIKLVESFVKVHPNAKSYISSSTQNTLLDLDRTLVDELLKRINVTPEHLLSFQRPLKQANDTILVLCSSQWSKLPFEQLRFIYFANKFLELEKQCYKFLKQTINECKEKHLCRTIRKIQRTLLAWSIDIIQTFHLDRLAVSKSSRVSYTKKTLFTLGYDCLENILVHLERFYSKYLDRELFVPFSVVSSRVNCLKPRVERLKLIILNQCYDSELLDTLFQPLQLVSNVSPKNRITYQQLMFIECFTNKLLGFYSKENHKSNSIELLHGYLIEMNYNSPTYLNYLTFKFSVELSNRQNVEAKLLVLYSWLKSVNQIIASSEVQYDRNIESVKSWIIKWLEEEIWYLKSTCPIQSNSINENASTSNPREKMKLNCSVNELALITRMFSETNLIGTKTHRELMELIAHNFQTSKVQDISVKSLSNKYYEPDTNTINTVKEKLIQMLNKLNQL